MLENLVDDTVPLIFNSIYIFLDPANAVVAVQQAADQELRGPAEDLGVALKQEKNRSSFGKKFMTVHQTD